MSEADRDYRIKMPALRWSHASNAMGDRNLFPDDDSSLDVRTRYVYGCIRLIHATGSVSREPARLHLLNNEGNAMMRRIFIIGLAAITAYACVDTQTKQNGEQARQDLVRAPEFAAKPDSTSAYEAATPAQIKHLNAFLKDGVRVKGPGLTTGPITVKSLSDEERARGLPGRTWSVYLVALPIVGGEYDGKVGVWLHVGDKWNPGINGGRNDAARGSSATLGAAGISDAQTAPLVAKLEEGLAAGKKPLDSRPSPTIQAPAEDALKVSSAITRFGTPLPKGSALSKQRRFSDGSGVEEVYNIQATGQEIITFFERAMQEAGWQMAPPVRAQGGNIVRTFYNRDSERKLFLATDENGGRFVLISS